VQAIKYVMDRIGRYGGPCRPPRGPLTEAHQRQLDADLARVV
jgi:dihydrodipicolinate synthase/N-acetylneuraminate lyase